MSSVVRGVDRRECLACCALAMHSPERTSPTTTPPSSSPAIRPAAAFSIESLMARGDPTVSREATAAAAAAAAVNYPAGLLAAAASYAAFPWLYNAWGFMPPAPPPPPPPTAPLPPPYAGLSGHLALQPPTVLQPRHSSGSEGSLSPGAIAHDLSGKGESS